ncbi:MAG: phosphatidylserine/phosphatidylglycerophosphate/cardiolipin synthase family protein [Patescibacteria group bacterium]|nr:phosphatidylserine/phosphatidylglycerophosphate/cardiolipin synthase family protein [Patescibacteria group bacterium]
MKYSIFSENSDFFDNLLKDMASAKKKIFIETYIFNEKKLGAQVNKILARKARQGIDVRLLIDAFGNLPLSEFDFAELIKAHGKISFFRRLLVFPVHTLKLNNRDHRKITIIDDEISYIGSSNIDENTRSWRELNLRVEDFDFNNVLSEIFLEQYSISNAFIVLRKAKKRHQLGHMEILLSEPFSRNPIRRDYLKMIEKAKGEIYIENPYFILDRKLARAFRKAIKRGVEITFMLPQKTDITVLNYLNKNSMSKARRIGARVLLYPGMIHSKMLLVDRKKWMLGSANLDFRSMYTQFEIMVKGGEGKICSQIQKHVEKGMERVSKNGKEFNGFITLKEKIFGKLFYPIRIFF